VGVAQVFTPGATMSEIVAWVRANVRGWTDRSVRTGCGSGKPGPLGS
jgi:hypothetical protein